MYGIGGSFPSGDRILIAMDILIPMQKMIETQLTQLLTKQMQSLMVLL